MKAILIVLSVVLGIFLYKEEVRFTNCQKEIKAQLEYVNNGSESINALDFINMNCSA